MNTKKSSKMSINIMDAAWFVYLLMSYTLGNVITYNHYIATGMLVIITGCTNSSKLKIGRWGRSILFYFAAFAAWITLSWLWAEALMVEQRRIVISLFEIVLMLICMIDYVENKSEKLQKLMSIYVMATAIFGIIYYASSPISSWGTEKMGGFTPIWRNDAGYYMTFAAAFSVYLYILNKKSKKKKRIWISMLLLIMALGTGSRKVFVNIALIIALYVLLQKGITRKIKMSVGVIILAFLAIIIGSQIPAFQKIYANRILSIFLGMESDDGSTIVRSYMRLFAFELFLQRPLIGNGLNAFTNWMASNTSFLARWNIQAMYSHCNQAELLCNAGIIGFLLYYFFPIIEVWKKRKIYYKSYIRIGISIIITYIILDYGTISYYLKIQLFIMFIGLMCLKIEK